MIPIHGSPHGSKIGSSHSFPLTSFCISTFLFSKLAWRHLRISQMRKQIIWVRQATIAIYEPKLLLGILKTDLLIHTGGLACQQLQIMDNRFASSIISWPHSVGLCRQKKKYSMIKCSFKSLCELTAYLFHQKERKKKKRKQNICFS